MIRASLLFLCASLAACGSDGPLIVSLDLPVGRLDHDYAAALEAAEARGPLAWSVVDGELPPGLDLAADGTLSGVPEATGTWAFSVAADDGRGEDVADLDVHVMEILLASGFGPFEGWDENPSIEALWPLDGEVVGDLDVRVVELPVLWDVAWEILEDEILALDPAAVVATGVASWHAMRLESLAQNEQHGEDNDGTPRNGEPVVEGGPETLATGLPVAEMAAAMEAAGFTSRISDDAGTYLCNHVFYHLEHFAAVEAEDPPVVGFVHVPPVPETTAFTLEDITAAHQVGFTTLSSWMAGGDAARRPVADLHDAPDYRRIRLLR